MQLKPKVLIPILALIIIAAGYLFYPALFKTDRKTDLEDLHKISLESQGLPTKHKIENVPFYGELTGNVEGFCYGYSSMMIIQHYGFTEEEVIEFRDFVQKEGRGGPPDIFLGFEKKGLLEKVNIAFSKNYNQQFAQIYTDFVEDPAAQIHILENQNTAKNLLKQLISQNTPVIVLINNGTDYDVAIGYDEQSVFLNDPHDKGGPNTQISWEKFLNEWSSEKAGAPGKVAFPGDWGMIWLSK